MKKLIASAALFLIAPAAFAGMCIVNTYNRNFFINADSSLPTLKIMSVTPMARNRNLSAAKILTPQVLNLIGYKTDICGDVRLSAMSKTGNSANSDARLSKDDVALTVRVGYDNSHYTDMMIVIQSTFFRGLKTKVAPINPQPHGISYVFRSISQSQTDNVTLNFTKQGN